MEAPAVPNLTAPRPTPPGRRDLAALPKAHLHLHFTGAMRPSTMIEMARTQGVRLPPHLLHIDAASMPADGRGWFRFQRAFDADPLTYKGGVPILTGATMIIQGDEVIARAGRLASPILVMHGSHDLMADLRGSRELVRGARAAHPDADIHLRIIDGAYHELLNEPEGPGLIRDIIIWLGEH